MTTRKLTKGKIKASSIILGCMHLSELATDEAEQLIKTAIDGGINYFDHADIYAQGQSEKLFGKVLTPSLRDKVFIQTKCGIRYMNDGQNYFDFSKEHILEAVDGSLQRLGIDYIDVLLLHRPDTLVEPEEVAEAFRILQDSGKVNYFGVSNQNPMQMRLLQKYLKQEIVANQLQLSLTETGMMDAGFNVNMSCSTSVDHDGGVLDYCRYYGITIQPWSPFQYGFFEGVYLNNPKFEKLNQVLSQIADKYGITPTGVVVAWLLRHPAKMQPIVGTTKPSRLREIIAGQVEISRQEWYSIYVASGKVLP